MIGTDPEFPIIDSKGKPVPAHRFLPAVENKHKLSSGGAAFRDGYMVELNVPPAETPEALARKVQAALKEVALMLPMGYQLSTKPVVDISEADLREAPADVLTFGCSPSYCAYEGRSKRPKLDARSHLERYAGGHMHFSAPVSETAQGKPFAWLKNRADHQLFIKMLDLYVGLPLTTIYYSADQWRRRKWYGQAGEYRPQQYPDGSLGLEYRTPSPEIWNTAPVARMAFAVGGLIFDGFETIKKSWDPSIEAGVRRAINEGIGCTDLLVSIEGIYDPLLIQRAARTTVFHSLQLPYQAVDRLTWTEWARSFDYTEGR